MCCACVVFNKIQCKDWIWKPCLQRKDVMKRHMCVWSHGKRHIKGHTDGESREGAYE